MGEALCFHITIMHIAFQNNKFGKIPLLRPKEIKTTSLLRAAFASPKWFLSYYSIFKSCPADFLIWVLRPFQEYFTYIEPIVHQRWAKTGEPGEKPPDHP